MNTEQMIAKLEEVLQNQKKSEEVLLRQMRSDKLELNATLDGIRNDLTQMKTSIDGNTTRINQLEQQLGETAEEQKDEIEQLRMKIASVEQKALSTSLILKGFPNNSFDVEKVVKNLSKHFNLTAGVRQSYQFSIDVGTDRLTNQPKVNHMLAISLNTENDKQKIFQKLKADGNILLKDLMKRADDDTMDSDDKQAEEEAADSDDSLATTPIFIESKLSLENLRIKRRLLELKRSGAITNFIMKSGLFLIHYPRSAEKRIIYCMAQLDALFPVAAYPKPQRGDEKTSNMNMNKRRQAISPTSHDDRPQKKHFTGSASTHQT